MHQLDKIFYQKGLYIFQQFFTNNIFYTNNENLMKNYKKNINM